MSHPGMGMKMLYEAKSANKQVGIVFFFFFFSGVCTTLNVLCIMNSIV